MSSAHSHNQLWIVGSPLDERDSFSEAVRKQLSQASLIIAESRKRAGQLLKGLNYPIEQLYFLDRISAREEQELFLKLKELKEAKVFLFSDTGMPILFDPGSEVLKACRQLGYEVRSLPTATSWATAMALSGYPPPFYLLGFLPQKKEERGREIIRLSRMKEAVVLLETPYRLKLLIEELNGLKEREIFFAWHISGPQEELFWGKISELSYHINRRGYEKGEFILILSPLTHVNQKQQR